MKIFISWSGDKSKEVATSLHTFLRTVLVRTKPWMSAGGIGPGQRWSIEIGNQLSKTNFGIMCVTEDNQRAPWLNFEAGALSKSLNEGVVVPYLFNMSPSDLVPGPLTQFQALQATKADTLQLVQRVNDLSDEPLDIVIVTKLFEKFWPDLESELSTIEILDDESESPGRDDSAKLDEVLELVRGMSRVGQFRQGSESIPKPTISWFALRQRASPQLKAFLMPAKGTINRETRTVRVEFADSHAFHANNFRSRLPEFTELVVSTLGAGYGVEIRGPGAGPSLADDESGASSNETRSTNPAASEDEEWSELEDLPF